MCTYYESYFIRIKDSVVSRRLGGGSPWQMAPLPETASYQVCHHSVPPHNCFLFTATFATFVVHLLQHCTQCSSTALQCGVVHWCGTGTLCSCTSSLLQYTAMWCALWCALWWAAELYSTGTHCPHTQFCIASVEQLYNIGSSKGV